MRMSFEMKDWKIVKSKSGYYKEYNYPLGEILVRDPKDIPKIIEEKEIHDPIIEDYNEP